MENSGQISDEVVVACVMDAADMTPGISLTPQFSVPFAPGIMKNEHAVKVSRKDNVFTIDIFVSVVFGINIPSIAWDLQENVKKKITELTDELPNEINVHVQGVELPKEDA